jgi:hypothetical protein
MIVEAITLLKRKYTMTVKLESRTQPKVLIATNQEPYDPVADTMQIAAELQKRLDETTDDVYFISDLRHVKVTFSDLVQGMAAAFKTPGSVFANPRLKTFTVGNELLVQLGAKAATEQDQYGRVAISLHTSVESAIEAVKKALAATS